MSTREKSPRPPEPTSEPATGIAHPTVVPTNFDPDAPGGRRVE